MNPENLTRRDLLKQLSAASLATLGMGAPKIWADSADVVHPTANADSCILIWLAGGMAQEMGVPAICGPRSVDTISRGFMNWAHNGHEGVRGVAAGYQQMGNTMVGFNTDSPVIPQEQLPLQAAMGVRYGFDDSGLEAVRGLTIVPAKAAHIDHLVGSIEVGKEADIIVVTGHPADPRCGVDKTYIDGRLVYDAERDGRRW